MLFVVCCLLLLAMLTGCGNGGGNNTICHDGAIVDDHPGACDNHGGIAGAGLAGVS